MDYLQSLLENSTIPLLSAFILGLMTAISPCPLATNITATAYISKNISSKKKVFLSGIVYSFGRAFSYTVIGLVLYFGASKFYIARFFSQNGEKYLGPLLILIGLVMLNVIRINYLSNSNILERFSNKNIGKGLYGSFILGLIFALAFCPYSGALFFGMLIPMSISSADGLYLPIIFAFGTGLPVIIFAYLLAFAAHGVSSFHKKITKIEKVMRYFVGIVFVLTGCYYVLIFIGVF